MDKYYDPMLWRLSLEPCKCGSSDLKVGEVNKPNGERVWLISCRSCGQAVGTRDKRELLAEWEKANTVAQGPQCMARAAHTAADAVSNTDLARAAVLLRELADIVERAARVSP